MSKITVVNAKANSHDVQLEIIHTKSIMTMLRNNCSLVGDGRFELRYHHISMQIGVTKPMYYTFRNIINICVFYVCWCFHALLLLNKFQVFHRQLILK